jgi:hypothetical protein
MFFFHTSTKFSLVPSEKPHGIKIKYNTDLIDLNESITRMHQDM